MNYPDYEKINAMALTVACPHHLCGAPVGEPCETGTTGEGLPHYARYELAVAPAVDEGVQKFAEPEPEPETRLVSLTCSAPANSRDPRRFTLLIEDEEANTVMAFDMDEHRFCLLMSHHVVKLEVS